MRTGEDLGVLGEQSPEMGTPPTFWRKGHQHEPLGEAGVTVSPSRGQESQPVQHAHPAGSSLQSPAAKGELSPCPAALSVCAAV